MERVKLKLTLPDSVNAKLQGMVSRGIAALEVDENGHLIVTLTDGSVHDLGKVSGEDGKDGQDGVSVTHEWDGTVLRVTSASGTSEADLKGRDGRDGKDGIDGKDGYTPIKGVDYFDGKNGVDGKDGYTPVKNVDYFDGRDGKDGVDGKDGYTPVKGKDYFDGSNGKDGVSATHTWSGTVLTMTSASGTSSADLKGERGEPGAGLAISGSVATYADLPNNLTISDAGEAYFVEADGKLYVWSGTAWPANGEGSQFKGDKGDPGKDGYTPVKGVDYFDGEDGYTPVKGVDYFDGKDGTSATHRWNGTVLEITSASGTSSADLKGATGDAGYTPQKGVDYFDGEDGYTPVKGVDYFDGKDGADGKDGYTPVKNKDYFDGENGVSATHRWNGTVLEVTSASGTSSADLKGATGDAGYTPQKGVDYFDGKDGKSAYQAAVDGGYTGTETGLNNALAAVPNHISDTTKHITEDERNTWNSKSDFSGNYNDLSNKPTTMTPSAHNHAAGEITSGTLAVARGGTGQTSLQATRNAMGLGNTTGALPVANGGTGATSAANARSNLGITPANIGAAASSHTHTKSQITDFPSTMTPSAHNQAASTITAGTFAGQVVANSGGETYSTYLLRNTRLASSDTTPSNNGEICWTYG